MVKGVWGQWGGPKHSGRSWGVSRGLGRGNNGVREFSGVTVCGVLDFKKQGEMENNGKDGLFGSGSTMKWECSGNA